MRPRMTVLGAEVVHTEGLHTLNLDREYSVRVVCTLKSEQCSQKRRREVGRP